MIGEIGYKHTNKH